MEAEDGRSRSARSNVDKWVGEGCTRCARTCDSLIISCVLRRDIFPFPPPASQNHPRTTRACVSSLRVTTSLEFSNPYARKRLFCCVCLKAHLALPLPWFLGQIMETVFSICVTQLVSLLFSGECSLRDNITCRFPVYPDLGARIPGVFPTSRGEEHPGVVQMHGEFPGVTPWPLELCWEAGDPHSVTSWSMGWPHPAVPCLGAGSAWVTCGTQGWSGSARVGQGMQDLLLPVLGDFQSWATSKQLSKRTPPSLGYGRDRWHRGCGGSAHTAPSPIGQAMAFSCLNWPGLGTSKAPESHCPLCTRDSSAWGMVLPGCDSSPAQLSPKGSHTQPGAVTSQGRVSCPAITTTPQFPVSFQSRVHHSWSDLTAPGHSWPAPEGAQSSLFPQPKNGHGHSSDTELLTFLFQSATAALHSLQHCPSSLLPTAREPKTAVAARCLKA